MTCRDSCRYSAGSGKTSLSTRENEVFPSKSEVVPGGRIPENQLLPVKTEVSPEREHGKNELYPEPLMNLKTLAQQPKEGSLA